MAAINQAIKEGKAAQTERALRNPNVALRGIVPECANSYQQALEGAMAKKRSPGNSPGLTSFYAACLAASEPNLSLLLEAYLSLSSGDTAFWVQHDMKDGTAYYFHLQTFQGTWEHPPSCHLNTSHLTWEEIQVVRVPARVRDGVWEEAPTHQRTPVSTVSHYHGHRCPWPPAALEGQRWLCHPAPGPSPWLPCSPEVC